jgi:hypothetical protein
VREEDKPFPEFRLQSSQFSGFHFLPVMVECLDDMIEMGRFSDILTSVTDRLRNLGIAVVKASSSGRLIFPSSSQLLECRNLHSVERPLVIGAQPEFWFLDDLEIRNFVGAAIYKDDNMFFCSSAVTLRAGESDD